MADLPESQNSTPEQQTSSSNRFFIPLFFGFSSNLSRESTEPDQETNRSSEQVVVMISFFNQDMMMIPNYMKDGPLPASKASIEAMRKSEISQEQGDDGECSICLERWKIGEEVREMPCKHLYHSNCIEKWLGIHGSCPVCRFKMPVDDEEESNKEERGTRVERELSEEERRLVMNLLGFLIPPSNNNNNNQEEN